MNKRIKIMCLSVLSLSLLSGRQVLAWPSFKKTAGSAVLAGVTYALWKNRDSVKDSIQAWKNAALKAGVTCALRQKRDSVMNSLQERKNRAQEWFKDRFVECKQKMSDAKEWVIETLENTLQSLKDKKRLIVTSGKIDWKSGYESDSGHEKDE